MRRQAVTRPTPPSQTDSTEAPVGEPTGAPSSSSSSVFDAAQRDFSRGNYQLAIAGYEEFLQLDPDSDRADEAQYWIGESYYSLGDMDRAIEELLKVRDLYHEGNAVPKATLKLGYAFLRKGDTATARRYFETVVSEYPNSDEAKLAQDKLSGL